MSERIKRTGNECERDALLDALTLFPRFVNNNMNQLITIVKERIIRGFLVAFTCSYDSCVHSLLSFPYNHIHTVLFTNHHRIPVEKR